MNDCSRIAPLLEVYADDESSAETNALVLDHLQHCDRCARELHAIVSLRAGLRESLGAGRAPAALRGRIGAAIDDSQPVAVWRRPLLGRLTRWVVPASATLVVLATWIARERPVDARVRTAVAEHVMCALEGRGPRLADAVAAERRLGTAMPWIRDDADGLRLVEAHTCGDAHPFSHLVLDVEGSTASILIAPRDPAGVEAAAAPPIVRDGFDVTVLTTARHVVYVIADRRHGDRLRALAGPALQRVERFLQQMEGAS